MTVALVLVALPLSARFVGAFGALQPTMGAAPPPAPAGTHGTNWRSSNPRIERICLGVRQLKHAAAETNELGEQLMATLFVHELAQ